jgi:DNA-binding beta-propeller fold protein YncE
MKLIQPPVRRYIALLVLALSAVALLPGTASAADVYVRTATIGSPGAGNGELNLSGRSGVAVNVTTEDVYVADTGNARIEQFEADGTFVRVFGSFSSPTFIAIDNSGSTPSGDVYVADSGTDTVFKFAADGSVVATWGTGGQIAGFTAINGIAVGPDGDLYVLSESTVSRFDPAGNLVGAPFASPRGSGQGLAVDTEGNLYKSTGERQIIKFDNAGARLAEPDTRTDAFALTTALDAGDLFVAQDNNGEAIINRYALNCGESCTPIESFGLNELVSPSGIAIGPTTRYVANAEDADTIAVFTLQSVEPPTVSGVAVGTVSGTSAAVTAEVNPNGFPVTSCRFQVVTDAQFIESSFANPIQVPCSASPGSGASPVPVEAEVEGLSPNTTYHVRLVAGNAAGATASAEPNPIFVTDAVAPVINAQSVIGSGSTETTLGAEITPGGAETTYRFEYLDEATFLAEGFASPATRSSPELGPLPADNSPHAVSVTIAGLRPNTAYRFRVVATNSVDTVFGAEPAPSFKTQRPSLLPASGCLNQAFRVSLGALLPECRAYEQVTPVNKGGLYIEGFPDLLNAAVDGGSVTYTSGAGTGFPASGGGRQDTTVIRSSRGDGAWSTQRLMPPEQLGEKAGFLGASRNHRFALYEAGTAFATGLFIEETDTESITPIVASQSEKALALAFRYDAIAEDGSRVLFESAAKLTSTAAPGRGNLYLWERASGQITLAGVLPSTEGGGAPPGGSFGGAYAWYAENPAVGGGMADLYVEAVNAASSAGDQIYFTAGGTGQLYLRRGLAGPSPTTVRVSKPEPGVVDPFSPLPAAFQEATPDGSHAFFTSPEKLTEDASTGEFDEGNDLYRYDRESERVVDVTADANDPENPNGARVLGLLGASSDGSSGFFAARGALAPGAIKGDSNIYRFDQDGTSFDLTFISTTDQGGAACGSNWSPSSYCTTNAIATYLGKTSRVTPDGQSLVFAKAGDLFIYRNSTKELSCISCSPTGATSAGPAELTAAFFIAEEGVIPRVLPAARLTHNISTDGTRVFFQTPNSLVDGDANGPPSCTYLIDNPAQGRQRPNCMDVYEWVAPGAAGGSCTTVEVNGGCLYLLSSGKSDRGSYLLDASSDGTDVFIATTSQLVPVDRDDLYDVYDVSAGGGIAAQFGSPGVPCVEESCRGDRQESPASSAPGSATFNGPGNPKPKKKACHKNKNHRHCGRKTHKKHKQEHHKGNRAQSHKGGQK